MSNLTLSTFTERYEGAAFLESSGGATRYTNGLEEGSEHESVWICDTCEHEAENHDGFEWDCACEKEVDKYTFA